MLSNLPLRPYLPGLLIWLLMLGLSGCAGSSGLPHPAGDAARDAARDAHVADRRLVPPDRVWMLSDGARIPVRTWLPAGRPTRAVVLALHGINDSRDGWEIPGPVLAADGIAVYAPDQRGFGAAPGRGHWPGTDRLVDDAAEMLRQVDAEHAGTPVYVMGESMGGAVAMCLAARPERPPAAGFVLLSPAVWSRGEMGPLMTASLWAASTFLPNWRLTGRELPLHVRASDNIAALYRLSYDPLTLKDTGTPSLRGLVELMTRAAAAGRHMRGPVLVAYGAHDQLVPQAAMAASWRLLPDSARRAFYPMGYHLLMRDKGREAVIGDVAGWIRDPGRPLPSGADVAASAWEAGGSWETRVPLLLPAGLDGLAGGGPADPGSGARGPWQ